MGNEQLSPEFYNALTECVDAVLAGERSIDDCLAVYPQFADLLKSDLQIVVLTQRLKSPRLGPPQVDALENRLRVKTARQSARKSPKIIGFPVPVFSRAAAAILLVFVMLIGGGGGVVAASADSDPGDDLYVVKRAWENVVIAFHKVTGIPEDIWVRLADTRLNEVRVLSERGQLTVAALEDLRGATERAIIETRAESLVELEPFLQQVQETLSNQVDLSEDNTAIVREIMTVIEPVIQEIRADSDSTPQLDHVDGSPSPLESPLPEEIDTPASVDITPLPEETATSTPIPTETFTATHEPTATATETVPPTVTNTPRFPPTPTRTPTLSPTETLSPTPTLNPTASWTPLPTPTWGGAYIPPTNATTQPTLPGTTYVPRSTATWYPWAQATFDAAYITQTAEAYELMTITAEATTP